MAPDKPSYLIIVTGAPAAGKTTVGRRLAEELGLPFIYKDGIKEILFDRLGWRDREWSKRLGAGAIDVLFHLVEAQLRANQPCVAEANFKPEFDTRRFMALKRAYRFEPLQIVCASDAAVLAERYRARAIGGNRHPGHLDQVLSDEFDATTLQDAHRAMALGGPVVHLDTSNLAAVDYAALGSTVASELGRLEETA